jgi:hypothetical protein
VHEQYAPAIALPDASRIGIAWSQDAATANWADLRWAESPDGGAKWFAAQTLASSASSSARRANDWPSIAWPVASTRYVVWNGWTANTNSYRLYIRKGTGTPAGIATAAATLVDGASAIAPSSATRTLRR